VNSTDIVAVRLPTTANGRVAPARDEAYGGSLGGTPR
jgi:hypothetical protein